jgi:hypothetical protein
MAGWQPAPLKNTTPLNNAPLLHGGHLLGLLAQHGHQAHIDLKEAKHILGFQQE